MKTQTYTELLDIIKSKHRHLEDTNIGQRNHLNQSYQQYQYLNNKNSIERLLENLSYLRQSNKQVFQDQLAGKYFSQIFVDNNAKRYSSSLLTFCKPIVQLLNEQQSRIRISHQHYNSQLIWLALYLRFVNPNKQDQIRIITTKSSFKNWQRQILDMNKCTDSEGQLKKLLQEININVEYANEYLDRTLNWKCDKIEQTSKNGSGKGILLLDFSHTNIVDIKPLVLSLFCKQKLPESQKIIIYHSHEQEQQVSNLLQEQRINLNDEFLLTEASLTYPIQIQYTQKDEQIKKNLIQFLQQEANHPQKQDIIIFYKNDHLAHSTAKRFLNKLKQSFSQVNNLKTDVLLSHIQFVLQKNQTIEQGKNHIFLVQNVQQLIEFNYSYDNVFYVIDFGWNIQYKYDHQKHCYIEILNKIDLKEKTKRLSFVGLNSKAGKYVYVENQYSQYQGYIEKAKEIMTYVLRMIDLGFSDCLEVNNLRVKYCLNSLIVNKIVSEDKQGKIYNLIDRSILRYVSHGINPIQAKMALLSIEKEKQRDQKQFTNLVIMALAVINTRGNLKQTRDSTLGNNSAKTLIKPSGIWRKSGYLDSCIQILTKAQIIQAGRNASKSLSRRKTSKINQQQYDVFGSLFQVITAKKVQFEDMKQLDDLIKQYWVNQTVFTQIRAQIDQLRQIFQIQQVNIKWNQTLLHQIIEYIASFTQKSIAVFSGSRRLGYKYGQSVKKQQLLNTQNQSIFPNKQSLIAQLNQTPQFLMILRCITVQNKKQIFMCNNINHESYMHIFGELPAKKNESLAEHEIEFHGISSSVFKGLARNNGIQIQKFQEQNKCTIEPNQEMATITIYCSKQKAQHIHKSFEEMLNKIKEKFINYHKIVHYIGNTNISMSNGGKITQIIKDNYINSCYLNNLDLEVTLQDLQELFDEFFVLKNIQILKPQPNKFSKSAIIQFNSQKDYYRFYSYYNQCKYFDRLLEVKPILMKKTNSVEQEMYIDFKWYMWKSHQKAIVIYKKPQSAEKAFQAFKQSPIFDGSPITFTLQKNKMHLDNLNPKVDQIYLEKGFSAYGQIQQVQILKTPLKQPVNQESLLDVLLRETLQIPRNQQVADKYKINQIQKHKNGLRKCKVVIKKIEHLKKLVQNLNQTKGKLGQSRLYTETMHTKPILVVYPGSMSLYIELLEETIKKAPQKPNIQYSIKDYGTKRLYIILRSPLSQTLKYIASQFQKNLLPSTVELTQLQKNIILSDIGIDNLIDLEQKFNCKLVVNFMKKNLEVICKVQNLKQIRQEINARVEDKFFYRISLNNKNYKNLSNNKEKIQQIKAKYFLTLLQIEEYSKTLIFQGSAHHVQNSLNFMMHYLQSFSKPQEQLINTQVCLICYQQLARPYRLQNCGHKFCFGCLDQCINSTLGDISMFPIKCPHCAVQLTIDDLQSLIDSNSWPKLINLSVTQFVGKNAQVMTFCYTPGCKQVNMLKLKNFKCDLCAVSFCCECKQNWHEGLTCEQAKLGTDTLFKKYMQQNGVRVCPNSACKMPIQRTDGCYRVTCSRCNKSMCFKCEPAKMIAYNDYNECYKHLNDVHGGYW